LQVNINNTGKFKTLSVRYIAYLVKYVDVKDIVPFIDHDNHFIQILPYNS